MSRPPRIFIGFYEIAGIFSGLQTGLQRTGCPCTFIEIAPHPFGYPVEQSQLEKSATGRLIKRWLRAVTGENPSSRWNILPPLLRSAISNFIFWILALKFDVFVFSIGISLANFTKHPDRKPFPFRLLKRRWVYLFTGTDSRAPYCGRHGLQTQKGIIYLRDLETRVAAKKECLRRAEAAGDLIIDFPSNAHFHDQPYINLLQLVLPVEHRDRPPANPPEQPIRIFHAPSNPLIKGSCAIAGTIEQLRERGHQIEYIECRNMPHDKLLEKLSSSDLVIDQLYSDSPMAGIASEASSFGIPVVVSGYFWASLDELAEYQPPPVVRATPLTLLEVLEELLSQPREALRQRGERARQFVREHATIEAFANRILRCLKGDLPDSWQIQPDCQSYALGCGNDVLETVELASALQQVGGDAAWNLSPLHDRLGKIYKHLCSGDKEKIPELTQLHLHLGPQKFASAWSLVAENVALAVELHRRGIAEQSSEIDHLKRQLVQLRKTIQNKDKQLQKLENKRANRSKSKTKKKRDKSPAARTKTKQSQELVAPPPETDPAHRCVPDMFRQSPLPASTICTLQRLTRRNQVLRAHIAQQQDGYRNAEVEKLNAKITNFSQMIQRRDHRILKLKAGSKEKRSITP